MFADIIIIIIMIIIYLNTAAYSPQQHGSKNHLQEKPRSCLFRREPINNHRIETANVAWAACHLDRACASTWLYPEPSEKTIDFGLGLSISLP